METLLEKAKFYVQSMKEHGHKVDCYSVKGSGKATEDCDIIIDVRGHHNFVVWPNAITEINPYGKKEDESDFNLTRIKFNESNHIISVPPKHIKHEGAKFMLKHLRFNENFIYEFESGYHRMVRYKKGTSYRETRTHNIDLDGNQVWMENMLRIIGTYTFATEEDALHFFSWLTDYKGPIMRHGK